MPAQITEKSNLTVTITEHGYESSQIPKNLVISDRKCNTVKSDWIFRKGKISYALTPDIYIVEIFLSSKKRFAQTIEIVEGKRNEINFDISILSPHEGHEWAYLTKNISPKPITFNDVFITGVSTTLWTLENGTWLSKPGPIVDQNLYADGQSLNLAVPRSLNVLEVKPDNALPIFVCLPPSENLKCLIKPYTQSRKSELVREYKFEYPVEIVVSTDKWIAESILSYLVGGSTQDADGLAQNSYYAEELLYNKIDDPASAAIGGYYLLKTYNLEMMHHWPKNLANWFEWMPDGPIIRAWQLLIDGKQAGKINREEIETLLLEAFRRGTPIYSEGLRLLHEGLRILSFNPSKNKKKDRVVKQALARVKSLCAITDWKKGTTTFSLPTFDTNEPFPPARGTGPNDDEVFFAKRRLKRWVTKVIGHKRSNLKNIRKERTQKTKEVHA